MRRRSDVELIDLSRRRYLQGVALALISASGPAAAWSGWRNECLDPQLTPKLPLEQSAWQDLNPADLWDCHTHIVGSGDSNSGIMVSEAMRSPLSHPIQSLQYWFYANAACANGEQQDQKFIDRLHTLMVNMPSGVKAMLYAFDRTHGATGDPDHINTSFFVPNEYAQTLAQRYPQYFEWVASIHP